MSKPVYAHLNLSLALCCALGFSACASSKAFTPKSSYPPDPWVKGYSQSEDCLGGEALSARVFELPDYPRRGYSSGTQGWVIIKLDVNGAGQTQNVIAERSVPEGYFDKNAINAVRNWRFAPPKNGALANCRVLLRYRAGEVSLGG